MENKTDVADTSPIINLLKINLFKSLNSLFSQLIVPLSVFKEIEYGKDKTFYINLSKIEWIKIMEPIGIGLQEIRTELNSGEADTIILGKELNADLVLLDEKLGRRIAVENGLTVLGTIGILVNFYKKGEIKNLESILREMKSKGTFLSENLIEDVIKHVHL